MALFRNRPLALVSLVFILGILAASLTDGYGKLIFSCLSVFALLGLFLHRRFGRRPLPHRPLILACLGALLLSQLLGLFVYDRYFDSLRAQDGKEAPLVGTVGEVSFLGEYATTFTLCLEEVGGERNGASVSVECDFPAALTAGMRISLAGTVFSFHDTRVRGEEIFLAADGICGRVTDVVDFSVLSSELSPLYSVKNALLSFREGLADRLTESVEGEGGALMSAMLLGTRDRLATETTRDFRRLGLSHLLALSGLHLSLLCGALALLLRRLGLGRRPSLLIQLLLILFYVALTGFSLSVIRAGIMAVFLSLSFFASRQNDSLTSLSLAAVLILLFFPYAAYDCGFWLSVVATDGIVIYSERQAMRAEQDTEKAARPFLAKLRTSLSVTLSAIFATLPLTALFFGQISLISPLTNLFLAPLFSLWLLLALPALLLAPVPVIGVALSFLGNALVGLVELCASLPFAVIDVNYPPLILLLFFTVLGTVLLLSLPAVRRRVLALCTGGGLVAATLLLVFFSLDAYANDRVYYRAAGGGDQLLTVSAGVSVLYDATGGTYASLENALLLMEDAHQTELSGLVLSHYHARHISTFSKLAARVYIRHLYLPTPTSEGEEDIYHSLVAAAEARGIPVTHLPPYTEQHIGRLTLLLHRAGEVSGAHAALGLTVKGRSETLTYLSRRMHESDRAKTAASAVKISDYLIFGTHGAAESKKLTYPVFKKELKVLLLPDSPVRLLPALRAELSARGMLRADTPAYVFSLS